jgi:C-terminal processing protease CtpA/Prc
MMVDQSAEFEVVARDGSGRSVTVRLPGVLDADRDKTANPVNAELQGHLARLDGAKDNVSLTFTDDSAVARLRIRGFGGQDYPGLIETAFRTVREKGTKALLLDLRGNGGGVDEYGAMLVSYFTDKPFRYFDHIKVITLRPSFATLPASTLDRLRDGTVPDPKGGYLVTPKLHKGVGEQAPGKYPFLGTALVLADGGTFSTAADVTAVLHNMERARFVGEETGGAYEGNTSGLNALVTLPASQLRLRVQMWGYVNAVSRGKKGRGTLADDPVEKRMADLLRGIDAPLERAVALARR